MLQNRTIDLTHIGGVKFIEDTHSYFNKDNERYTGVTTFLEQYKNKFDTEKGSFNSAIKYVIIENFGEEKFNDFKKLCRDAEIKNCNNPADIKFIYGHNFLYKRYDAIVKKYPHLKEEIEKNQIRLKEEWSAKSLSSTTKGSIEHGVRENLINENGYTYDGVFYKYLPEKNILNVTLDDIIVIPECLVWNHRLKLAGLSDIALFNRGVVSIQDYKTNESIDFNSFNNIKMKGIFSELEDCSYNHYSSQLDIYQHLATTLRPEFKKGDNFIIHTKSEEFNREDKFIKCLDIESIINKIF